MVEPGREFKELTICYRSYALAYDSGWWPFWMYESEYEFEFKYGIKFPLRKYHQINIYAPSEDVAFNMVYFVFSSRKSHDITKNQWSYFRMTKKPLNAKEWHHICHVYSVPKKMTAIVHNGDIVANRSQSEEWANEDNFFTSYSFLPWDSKKYIFLFCPQLLQLFFRVRGFLLMSLLPLLGYLTDFQIWDKALSYEEMSQITTCQSFPGGNLIPWNMDDYAIDNTTLGGKLRVVEVNSDLFCPKPSRFLHFPGRNAGKFHTMSDFCQMFGGTVVNMTTKEQREDITEFFSDMWRNPKWSDHVTNALANPLITDGEEEGTWRSVHTTDPKPDILWDLQEPNGEIGENCLQYYLRINDGGKKNETIVGMLAMDVACSEFIPILCENTRRFVGKLYGLCKESRFDKIFLMTQEPTGVDNEQRRSFSGNYGWELSWDDKLKAWKLFSKKFPETYATQSSSDYPLGRKTWAVFDDKCNIKGGMEELLLTFSACEKDEFTCDSGNCIPMKMRCDQKEDCKDVSDEKNCQTVIVDPKKYLKDKPPPALEGKEKCEVKVRVDLLAILSLAVVDMKISLKYELNLEWLDPRTTFYNLKENINLNGLVQEEMRKIWSPTIIFTNTQSNIYNELDKKSIGLVSRRGSFTQSSIDEFENIYKFQGKDNPISISRVYETEWLCEYDLRFDFISTF